jgi:uncharacterized protein YjbJ (UPF0337 family)
LNNNRVNGTIDEVAGSTKRKAGELTGNTRLQVKGVAQQVKGKVENAWGKATDAVQEANKKTAMQHETHVKVNLECSATNAGCNKKK